MADGFIPLSAENIKTPEGISQLNRMLQAIYDNIPGDTVSVRVYSGYGSPLNVVAAGIGSFYMRLDGGSGTTFYIKESGTDATGWTAISTSGGGGAPAGSDTWIQYNDGGMFGAESLLTYNKTTDTFTANSLISKTTDVSIPANFPFSFEGVGGDTKIVYESAATYLRFYINGTLRVEM